MSDRAKPVVIAGGGIGGLTAALALAREGFSVHVCERRDTYPEEGAGIQLGPNATKVLKALGAGDILEPAAGTPDRLVVHDGLKGTTLTELPLGGWIRDRHGAPYWTAHRADLHASLRLAAERNERISLQTGAEVTAFDDKDEGISAVLGNATRIAAHAVIGADGLWSRLRGQVTATGPLTAAGKCAYRGVIPRSSLPQGLSANDVHIWMHPGAHVVHYPVRAGREIALVAVLDDQTRGDSWSLPAPNDWVQRRAGELPPLLKTLLGTVEAWRMWSLQSLPRLATWNKGRVALLGDAAHPVFPFLAQGGVLAIEDASVLAKCLKTPGQTVAGQLAAYSRVRQPRAARVADASKRNGSIYHLRGASAVARNTVLRTSPPKILMAAYDWLYGFEA